jgi:N-acetylglucosamine-6-phosphate deacetylase
MRIIDIHTHGIGGYDTRAGSVDDILRIASIHGARGTCEVVLSIYAAPVEAMRENMITLKRAMTLQRSAFSAERSVREESQLPTSNPQPLTSATDHPSRILGAHLEGPFLNPNRCGALDRQSFLPADERGLRRLLEGFEDIVKIVTIAPELAGANRLIRLLADMGIIVSMGHSEATYAEAEAGFHAGAKGITHMFNAMRGFHHREPGIVGFGLLNREIFVEVIADPYHLHHTTVELIFRLKNPERILVVSDSARESYTGSSPEGVRDGAGTLLGGSMTVTESAERLIDAGYDRELVVKCITDNPAAYLA